MTMMPEVDVNDKKTLTTLLLFGALLMGVLLLAPAMVGAFITELGFTPAQAGYIISADMAGLACATLPALWWLNRANWQRVFLINLLLTVVLHLISASLTEFEPLLVARFLCGLSGGTVISVCLASIGLTRNPDRNYALWVAGQLVIGAVGLAILPDLLPEFGVKIIFLFLAISLLAGVFFSHNIPTGQTTKVANVQDKHGVVMSGVTIIKVSVAVVGLYLFYVALSGVWVYIERIGVVAELAQQDVGYVLAIASTLGIVGALTASTLDTRFGRLLPTFVGVGIIVAGLVCLYGVKPEEGRAFLYFVIGACLFKFSWTFTLPYFLASIASQDSSGKAIVSANVFVGAGLASGPAIAGLMTSDENYTPLITLGIVLMAICFVLFLPLLTRRIVSTKKATTPEAA